jgi:DNA-binding response OmpR family regulator
MRILIVEDQADIRDVLHETFTEAGHTVTLAANVQQAEAALAAGGPDAPDGVHLLLTDLLLPGGSGLALAAGARARGIRVLLCSGHPDQMADLAQRGIPLLHKPFTLQHLLDQVAAVMAAPDMRRART